ncbi:acyl-CoA 6-desaturase-like [Condylostylus longicornis]|uniref:acyl-CoA 6-desaturase-like n=1 Tax=Condylostylus longicornis TaxID=2530218 RepID=UPI00244DDD8D|nr:acyl-CoA 6-desaturase-like [Condylostylus longicornis]
MVGSFSGSLTRSTEDDNSPQYSDRESLTITGVDSDFSRYLSSHHNAILIGVDGGWYDVTSFRHRHPGGAALLEKSHGRDVTEIVTSFHEGNVLKGWRPVGFYSRPIEVMKDPAAKAFRDLHKEFSDKGYFKTSMEWHNEMTHNRFIDQLCGIVFGSFFTGISSSWWRDEHFEHHAFTNVADDEGNSWDVQMQEDLWAQIYEGVLHVQLLLSHYGKPWTLEKDLMVTTDWYRAQILSNLDIKTPIWMDWFHGGLNFHQVHHLYPRMPRHRFREATKRVREVCEDVGLKLDECSFTEALWRTLTHLKKMGRQYSDSIKSY